MRVHAAQVYAPVARRDLGLEPEPGPTSVGPQAASAFDEMAPEYDLLWTQSNVGRAQRQAVWSYIGQVFRAGAHILELNCGTGEDAMFLARAGMSVTACDASIGMIRQAEDRYTREGADYPIRFHHLASEQMAQLGNAARFDGLFSNFSGLNCVSDLPALARALHGRLTRGAPVLLCLSTRFCLWEIAYHGLRGRWEKALRRCRGRADASLHGFHFPVFYPTLRQIRQAFSPGYRFRSVKGIGVFVPPSYLERWSTRHPRALAALSRCDRIVCRWPGLRVLGDHMLLHLEAV